jgi:hypothetical protein
VRTQSFPHDVRLTGLTATNRIEDGCTVTTAVLTLDNLSAAQSEYVARIELPPGVLVSGYWLHVGPDRVPGQIFEKKTAQWVYQMIRDVTRRDPGLLVYTAPNTLELRVFPFAGAERRVTEIEFLSPPGLQGTVMIGARPMEITSPSADPSFVGGASRLILPEAAGSMLPEVRRRPYLHFIVDRSANSGFTPQKTIEAIRRIAAEIPEANACRVTAANYEFADLTEGLLPLERVGELAALPEGRWLPKRGALLHERAIKRGLLRYGDDFSAADENSPWLESYPIFVVLSSSMDERPGDGDLAWFSGLAPDADGFFSAGENGGLWKYDFEGKWTGGTSLVARGVRIFRAGKSLAVAPSDGPVSVQFSSGVNTDDIQVFDPDRRKFEPVTGVQPLEKTVRYARGLAALEGSEELIETPSNAKAQLPEIIKASRSSGVLVPSSAYIVVENSAQWKMLKMKEQQKMRGHKDLDFMESPEPSAAAVALIVGLFSVWRSRASARARKRG